MRLSKFLLIAVACALVIALAPALSEKAFSADSGAGIAKPDLGRSNDLAMGSKQKESSTRGGTSGESGTDMSTRGGTTREDMGTRGGTTREKGATDMGTTRGGAPSGTDSGGATSGGSSGGGRY